MIGNAQAQLQVLPGARFERHGCSAPIQPDVVTIHTLQTDEFAAAFPDWLIDCQQLGRGQFRATLFRAHTSRLGFMHICGAPGMLLRAVPPENTRVLLMLAQEVDGTAQRDGRIDAAAMLAPCRELDLRLTHPFGLFLLVAERELIEDHASALLQCRLGSVTYGGQVALEDAAAKRRDLARLTRHVHEGLSINPMQLRTPALAGAFEDAALDAFLCGIRAPQRYITPRRRHALAWAAESFLRENVTDAVSIKDLCRATGSSERSLHLAFKVHFGTTPKAYLKMLRMNGVRRSLQNVDESTTVTSAAFQWGFLHLSWFSHDYRLMFGESPTATLRGARRNARLQFSDSSAPQSPIA